MSSSKVALKAIKSAIDKGDFNGAADAASELVGRDTKNYTGYIFLGFARDKINQCEDAERAYEIASSIKPGDPQALKGLITLYEKQGSAKLDKYHEIVQKLAEVYAGLEDSIQCQTVVDKYEVFAKKHGSGTQYRHALELISPTSSIYSFLEGRLPRPSHTYTRILESAEAEEKEWTNVQIGERRTRLGAKIDQVTQQVKLEAIHRFQIEAKYRAVIDWIEDDDLRHEYEEKLLQRAYDDLILLPDAEKPLQRDVVLNLANGMVTIEHPYELAWKIVLDWLDVEELSELQPWILRSYIALFPQSGMGKVLRGFFGSSLSPFGKIIAETKDEKADLLEDDSPIAADSKLSEAENLIIMTEGLEDCPDSPFSNRLMAQTYLSLEEFQSAADAARKSQRLHVAAMRMFGTDLQNSLDSVNMTLAQALISYQSPRHHQEARSLFGEVLERKPKTTTALLGVGLILEEDEDYGAAVNFLERASNRDPQNLRISLELAWCRALDDDLKQGLVELENILTAIEAQKPIDLSMKSEALYRIGYCKWNLYPTKEARKDKMGAYKDLIDSIKANSSYAPPYTLLGMFFEDYGRSRSRARVAFQKAFELSTSEVEAAHRLARNFADATEWDLVELVAKRVIDSGKARPAPGSKKKAHSWPYTALGVVEMNRQQYTKAIVAYQSALRISPGDYHSWVGLGESYHHSGRYIAATRAFLKAENLDHGLPLEQTWFAKFMLANVQREMSSYEEAIEGFKAVLKIKRDEFGVLMALLQTLSESALAKIELGMFGEASNLAREAIDVSIHIVRLDVDSFNLWKSVADACSVLASAKTYASKVDLSALSKMLLKGASNEIFQTLQEIDGVEISESFQAPHIALPQNSPADACAIASILCHKRSINAAIGDVHARAVSWYNLGWAEYQAYRLAIREARNKTKKTQPFLKAAMRCFKHAIELEARNSDFWNALGIVTMTLSPKVSQHSFIRSLHLNERSARVWTNLGILYLFNNDTELANEAFTRSQSADPEYSYAWLGQGILASLYGNMSEARGLFAHAFDIAGSSSLPTKRQFAVSAFDHLIHSSSSAEDLSGIIRPLFALHQLHSQSPSETNYNHLSALFAERLGEDEEAKSTLTAICAEMEAEYENSESEESLAHFAQAKADLARIHLASHEFEEATDCAEMALDLSSEGAFGARFENERRRWRLSAHLTAGVSYHYLNESDKSLSMFQAALQEANGAADVVCRLAQVLWAKGGEEERSVAREQLFDCIQKDPEHVGAVTLLGVIALLDNDMNAIEAVQEDLQAMRLNGKLDAHDKIKVANVLAGITACETKDVIEVDGGAAMMREPTRGVMIAPGQPEGWSELAAVTGEQFPADMALQNALRQMPPGGTLEAGDLSKAYAQTAKRRDALQAVMVAPWLEQGYKALVDSF